MYPKAVLLLAVGALAARLLTADLTDSVDNATLRRCRTAAGLCGKEAVLFGRGGGPPSTAPPGGDCGTVGNMYPAVASGHATDPRQVTGLGAVFLALRRITVCSQLLGLGRLLRFTGVGLMLLICCRISSGSKIFNDSQSLTWPIWRRFKSSNVCWVCCLIIGSGLRDVDAGKFWGERSTSPIQV